MDVFGTVNLYDDAVSSEAWTEVNSTNASDISFEHLNSILLQSARATLLIKPLSKSKNTFHKAPGRC